jgi:hypothetical protein
MEKILRSAASENKRYGSLFFGDRFVEKEGGFQRTRRLEAFFYYY